MRFTCLGSAALLWISCAAPTPVAPAPLEDLPESEHPRVLDIARDGSVVAVARKGGRVELWDPRSLEVREILSPDLPSPPWALALAPDGARLAALCEDGELVVWDLSAVDPDVGRSTVSLRELFQPRRELPGHRFGAVLAFSPDGARLLAAHHEGFAALCSAEGELLARWEITPCFATPPAAWTPDGKGVLSVLHDQVEIRALEFAEGAATEPALRRLGTPAEVGSLAVHPTRPLLVTGHDRRRAILWDLRTGERLREESFPGGPFAEDDDDVGAAAFSPDGRHLALSTRPGSHVFVLDLERWERVWTSDFLGAHFWEPLELTWSPDSSRLWWAFACGGGEVGSHALSSSASPAPVVPGALPRFGGGIGLIRTSGARPRVARTDGKVEPPPPPVCPLGVPGCPDPGKSGHRH